MHVACDITFNLDLMCAAPAPSGCRVYDTTPTTDTSDPRPLLIRFGAVRQKYELLKQSKALRAQQVYLDDDLTPFQRGLRAKLSTDFKMLKNYKRPRFWRQERLFTVHGGKLVQSDLHFVPSGCAAAAAA